MHSTFSRVLNPGRLFSLLAIVASFAHGQQTFEVIVKDYHFQPQEIRIKAGDTVKWINQEKRTSHSVVFPAEQGGESERFFPDESWQKRFDNPGRYTYHCGPHPEMTGAVEVSAP